MNKIFVYGTLLSGFGNHKRLLEDKSTYLGTAKIRGKMFSMGGFPGVAEGEECINGEVYEVNDEVLKSLDILEGHPNVYKRTVVELIPDEEGEWDGYKVETYICQHIPKGAPEIPHGSWRKYVEESSKDWRKA